jgi:hypothetical protein
MSDLACNLSAIPQAELETHKALAKYLIFEGSREKKPLEDGYALGFAPEDYPRVTQFVANERLCCAFMKFEIHVEAEQIWLYLRGGPGVKAFLESALGGRVNVSGSGLVSVDEFMEIPHV